MILNASYVYLYVIFSFLNCLQHHKEFGMENRSEDSTRAAPDFCLEKELFLSVNEATHPRASAIAAYYEMVQLSEIFSTQAIVEEPLESAENTFAHLKEIVLAEQARRPQAPGGRGATARSDLPIDLKLNSYDSMVVLLNGYQDYPLAYQGEHEVWTSEQVLWNSICDFLGI